MNREQKRRMLKRIKNKNMKKKLTGILFGEETFFYQDGDLVTIDEKLIIDSKQEYSKEYMDFIKSYKNKPLTVKNQTWSKVHDLIEFVESEGKWTFHVNHVKPYVKGEDIIHE